MTTLKIFTAFSGYDSQMVALQNRLKLDCELVGWSEIDKYAIAAHNILFPEYSDRNFGDIQKINWSRVPDFDLLTYSSPCQDLSIVGEKKGAEKGSGTRSSLLWECAKAIKTKKPKYLLLENVDAIVNKNNIKLFEQWCETLRRMGYTNYWKVLNALDYNVPQNRKRLYMVSILDGKKYTFPNPKKLTKSLEDIAETDVDSKYYLNNNGLKWRIETSCSKQDRGMGFKFSPKTMKDYAGTINTHEGNHVADNYLISPSRHHQSGKILNYYKTDTFRTVTTSQSYSTSQWLKYAGQIRRLTPSECLRLMGLNDSEISALLKSGISDTQLYKLAGNSIVVDVLAAIFGNLFGKGKKTKDMKKNNLGGCVDIAIFMSDAPKGLKPKFKVGDWVYWDNMTSIPPSQIAEIGYLSKSCFDVKVGHNEAGFYYRCRDYWDRPEQFAWSENYYSSAKKPRYTSKQWGELNYCRLVLRRLNKQKRRKL